LEAGPGGGAFVVLPVDVLTRLGGRGRLRVRGRLNGVEFASSTMAMGGGCSCLGVHKVTRQAAAVDIADTVEIDVEADTAPRTLELPAELAAAFAEEPAARSAFDRWSFTRRREHIEGITSAKRVETRARRIAQTLEQARTERR
jgi:Bacteriocin-protection, YdeI or OmpD-Associated/Domain of unknown function (DUF1905)